jgi:imidazolonepropionase-like amidohydrolase
MGAALASAQSVTVIKNATVYTVSNGTLTGASIVIRGGKIAEVGTGLLIPGGATEIDATGMHVTPGLIDAHIHYGADAVNEGSVSVSSMVSIEDVLNGESLGVYRALTGGVTTGLVLHGSANAIGGQSYVIRMLPGKTGRELLFPGAMPGIKFALGENPKRAGQGGGQGPGGQQQTPRYPGTRMGVEDVIRSAFVDAKRYQAAWKSDNERRARGENPLPPRKDLKLEPLVEILEGKRLVHAHCYRADEILMLLRVADEMGFKIATLQHVLEGYKVAKEIAAHGAGASTFSDWWAYKVEAYDAIPYNAAIMHKKGVLVSLNSDDLQGELTRRMNLEAAKVMKYGGLSADEALAMVTLNPAKQLRIDRWAGSIEAGKNADLVIFDKDPLSVYSKPLKVLVDGVVQFDREKDREQNQEKLRRKQTLIQREKDAERRTAPPVPAAKKPAPGGEL